MFNAQSAANSAKTALTGLIDEISVDLEKAATQGYTTLSYRRVGSEIRFAESVEVNRKTFEEAGYEVSVTEEVVSLNWGDLL